MRKYSNQTIPILIFVLPTLILFSVLVFYPIIQVVYLSFFRWDGITEPVFRWFSNYKKMFSSPIFYTSLLNGLKFAAVLFIYQIGVGSILALLLANKKLKGRKFFKASYFIPVVLSITVTGLLWVSLLNYNNGLINKIFELIGISFRQKWLSNPDTAIYAVAFSNAWQYMGIIMILLYASIKSIPEHYYEAALVDGASTTKAHLKITIPLLAETYRYCSILAITGGLKAFENMYIMTGGGPGTSTYTLSYYMYSRAFIANQYGLGSAGATALVIECLLFLILINKFIARERVVY